MNNKDCDKTDSEYEVEVSKANTEVWMIKVPKYLSSHLESAQPMSEIGKIRITTNLKNSKSIEFNVSKQLVESDNELIPIKHKFSVTDVENQTIAIFTQNKSKISVEAKVVMKGECRPAVTSSYLTLNKERMKKASQPLRVVQQLNKAAVKFKPKSQHMESVSKGSRRGMKCKIKMKTSKEIVEQLLFTAFERHQYYSIKDLQNITQQPIPHLKQILHTICAYNVKNPHKNMWQLKPEFRHYDKQNQ